MENYDEYLEEYPKIKIWDLTDQGWKRLDIDFGFLRLGIDYLEDYIILQYHYFYDNDHILYELGEHIDD